MRQASCAACRRWIIMLSYMYRPEMPLVCPGWVGVGRMSVAFKTVVV